MKKLVKLSKALDSLSLKREARNISNLIKRSSLKRGTFTCYSEKEFGELTDDIKEEADELIRASSWPGFDNLKVICIDGDSPKTGVAVGTISVDMMDEILFLVDEDYQGNGIANLMFETLLGELDSSITEEMVFSDDYEAPYSAVAGSDEGAGFLFSLPSTFGWRAFAMIDWDGWAEEKEEWAEQFKKIEPLKLNVAYHGTTEDRAKRISSEGFSLTNIGEKLGVSGVGISLTTDKDIAIDHANIASEKFGGNPAIIILDVSKLNIAPGSLFHEVWNEKFSYDSALRELENSWDAVAIFDPETGHGIEEMEIVVFKPEKLSVENTRVIEKEREEEEFDQ